MDEVLADTREATLPLRDEGVKVSVAQTDVTGGGTNSIELLVTGPDFGDITDVANELATKIEDIEGIGPAFAEKLAAAKIATTDDLLKLCCQSKGRKEIAATTGAPLRARLAELEKRHGRSACGRIAVPVAGRVREALERLVEAPPSHVDGSAVRSVAAADGLHLGDVLFHHRIGW